MVARADGDTQFVEQQAHVVAADVTHQEGHYAALAGRRTEEPDAVNRLEFLNGGGEQFMLVGSDIVNPQALDVVDGGTKAAISTKSGVPASNLKGKSAKVVRSKVTCPIISPPP